MHEVVKKWTAAVRSLEDGTRQILKRMEERRTLGAVFSDQWFESPRTVN
jgi:hypothetical protein